jgi:cold shock protein
LVTLSVAVSRADKSAVDGIPMQTTWLDSPDQQAMQPDHLWRPTMARGTVKWFNSTKGYGFIQPQASGKDIFVHISAVEGGGLPGLNGGQGIE